MNERVGIRGASGLGTPRATRGRVPSRGPALLVVPVFLRALCAALALGAAAATAQQADSRLAEADRLWRTRAEQLDGRLAVADRTEKALSAYRQAIDEAAPIEVTIEARWKALRAAHYLSEFTTASQERTEEAIRRSTELADGSLAALAQRVEAESVADLDEESLEAWLNDSRLAGRDVAQIHFWSAIVWGAHGQRVGLFTIVREGIAGRMHENARLATRVEPAIERGGAFRLLSRLHADLPRIPFVSGWVDREKVIPMAERALEIAPKDPGNELIMALALRDREPDRRERIRSLLESVASLEPRPELRAEDLAIREQARELLEADFAATPARPALFSVADH